MKQKSKYPEIELDLPAIDLAQKQVATLITYVQQYTTIPLNKLLLLDQRSFQIDQAKNTYGFYVQSKIDNTIYGIVAVYDTTKNTFSEIKVDVLKQT